MEYRFALVFAFALATVSCGGTSQPPTVESASATPEAVANPDPNLPANPPAMAGGASLSSFAVPRVLHHLGKHRSVVMHLDAELVRQSPSFPILDHFLLKEFAEDFDEVETKCGFSPLQVWSTLTIAWQESANKDGVLVGFSGDLTRTQVNQCSLILGDGKADDKLKDIFWPDSNMALYEKGTTVATLEHEIDKGSLIDNAAFMAELNGIKEPYASVWAVGILPDELRKTIGNFGMGIVAPTSFTLSVNLENGIDATMAMKFATASEADSMKNAITSMLPMLSSGVTGPAKVLTDALMLDTQDTTTTLSVQLGQLEVEDLLKTL